MSSAPEPRDVYWPNMRLTPAQRSMRKIIAQVLTVLLVFFWSIPVTFVASLTTLEALSSNPGLGWIDDIVSLSPVLKGFLEGFLPTLAVLIFYLLLPKITTGMRAFVHLFLGIHLVFFFFFFFLVVLSSLMHTTNDLFFESSPCLLRNGSALAKFQGYRSRSAISAGSFKKLYWFYFVNLFFVVLVAGSIFGECFFKKSIYMCMHMCVCV